MIAERSLELGRLIGQSEDYKALVRARESIEGAAELKTKLDRLRQVGETLEQSAGEGKEPDMTYTEEYDRLLSDIQGAAQYQRLVAAQSNFDKLILRVQEQIMEGVRKGAESPIITPG